MKNLFKKIFKKNIETSTKKRSYLKIHTDYQVFTFTNSEDFTWEDELQDLYHSEQEEFVKIHSINGITFILKKNINYFTTGKYTV